MAPDIEAVLKLVKKGKVCAKVYSRAGWKQTGSIVTQWLTQGWKQLVCIHQCPITILLTTLLYLTIRLWALDFYCEIVDYHRSSSHIVWSFFRAFVFGWLISSFFFCCCCFSLKKKEKKLSLIMNKRWSSCAVNVRFPGTRPSLCWGFVIRH